MSTIETGKISDGYHTFDELYDHRITLWIALCKQVSTDPRHQYGHDVWRSRLHSDGSEYEGWFLLGMGTEPGAQRTYHLPMNRWDEASFATTLDQAPEYDGHTSLDVLNRIQSMP